MVNKHVIELKKKTFIPLIIFFFFLVFGCRVFGQTPANIQEHFITILSTNDIHGHLEPFSYNKKGLQGGAAKRKNVIDKIRNSTNNVLVLDAGDFAQGTLFFKKFAGQASSDVLETTQYDAIELGNHEFDKGIKVLEQIVLNTDVPILCSNLKFNNKVLDKKVKDYIIKDYNGFHVGVVGLITESLKSLSSHDNDIEILDAKSTLQDIVNKTDPETDLIIVLSHMGLKKDMELAKSVTGIDVIIGGHSHTLLKEPKIINNNANKVIITQSGEFGVKLGRLDLKVKDDKISNYNFAQINIDKDIQPDFTLKNIVNSYSAKLNEYTQNIIGTILNDIDARRDSVGRSQTTAGLLVTTAIKNKYPQADVIFENSGGIRYGSIKPAGQMTHAELMKMYPFDNYIVQGSLKGSAIKSILETANRFYPKPAHCYLQTQGVEYILDLTGNAQVIDSKTGAIVREGSRIKSVKINNKNIEPEKYYTVLFNNFVLNGGDGFTQFKQAKNIIKTYDYIDNVILEYLKNNSPVKLESKEQILIRRKPIK